MDDPYNLQRFVEAQVPVYARVRSELRNGKKESHWIWFVFPQIKGLGTSATARKFAISCRDEAIAYLEHPLLGSRLRECTRLVMSLGINSIEELFVYPDNLKFRSSMTLFASVASDNKDFMDALKRFYDGKFDQLTIDRL